MGVSLGSGRCDFCKQWGKTDHQLKSLKLLGTPVVGHSTNPTFRGFGNIQGPFRVSGTGARGLGVSVAVRPVGFVYVNGDYRPGF